MRLSSTLVESGDGNRDSLHHRGFEEALRHKWIVSEVAGRDLGEEAIHQWIRDHWHGFCRHRWLQHLEGTRYWIELDPDDFALLRREFLDSDLIKPIVNLLRDGKENLSIIAWAIDQSHDLEEVHHILAALDINSWRLEVQFGSRRSQAS
jgi:hypothetical protein